MPEYDNLRIFGCLAFAYNPTPPTDKFDHKGVPCIFLGYPAGTKGYKLMNLLTKKEFTSRDVIFQESIFYFHKNSSNHYMSPTPPSMPTQPTTDMIKDFNLVDLSDNDPDNSPNTSDTNNSPISSSISIPTVSPVPIRKSMRTHKQPTWMQDFHTNNATYSVSNLAFTTVDPTFECFMFVVISKPDPILFKEAVKEEHWVKAMNIELNALELNNIWDIVTLPQGKKAIGSKWIYKTKFKPNGEVEKHKARLVILGCYQKPCVDFNETFAPVAKLTTVRTILAVASIQGWFTHQMDVSNAFLDGELSETVFMKLPKGYMKQGSRISLNMDIVPTSDTVVCKLRKSLYGL